MKIAYKHLLRFLKTQPSIDEISSKLFQLGHEHEINEEIFDIEFTPNRGDCLSLKGLSRDLNVFYGNNEDIDIYKEKIKPLEIDFKNNAKELCPIIHFLNIEINDNPHTYKNYLENYFIDLNINKTNFFTDVSNYVAYEIGQPTHCYDKSKINGSLKLEEIESQNNSFNAIIDNKQLPLKGRNLVFKCKNEIINLAGIMGGVSTSCTKDTKNALIESAHFIPEAIIGKSVKYNIHSDASYKFERYVDPLISELALRRFISIVADHAEINRLEIFTFNNYYHLPKEIDVDCQKVNDILGSNIDKILYEDTLSKLGLFSKNKINIPSFRPDINNANDIAEEIARTIGYNNLPSEKLNIKNTASKNKDLNEEFFRAYLVSRGFFEVINFPFAYEEKQNTIKIDNPIDVNKNYLRTSLKNSLIENLKYNENRQQDIIKFFEISDVYTSDDEISFARKIGMIVTGRLEKNYINFSKKISIDYINEILDEIGLSQKKTLVKEISRDEIDSKLKNKIFYVEFNIEGLKIDPNLLNNFPKNRPKIFKNYIPISEYPKSYRDLSFSIEDPSSISKLINLFLSLESDILKDVYIFDYYNNSKKNIVKVGFRMIFQSNDKTLKDAEIDGFIQTTIQNAYMIKSVEIPGYKL